MTYSPRILATVAGKMSADVREITAVENEDGTHSLSVTSEQLADLMARQDQTNALLTEIRDRLETGILVKVVTAL